MISPMPFSSYHKDFVHSWISSIFSFRLLLLLVCIITDLRPYIMRRYVDALSRTEMPSVDLKLFLEFRGDKIVALLLLLWLIIHAESLICLLLFCLYLIMFLSWYYRRPFFPWLLTDLLWLIGITVADLYMKRLNVSMNRKDLMPYAFLSRVSLTLARATVYAINAHLDAENHEVTALLIGSYGEAGLVYYTRRYEYTIENEVYMPGSQLDTVIEELVHYLLFFIFTFLWGCRTYYKLYYYSLPIVPNTHYVPLHVHVFNVSEHVFMWLSIAVLIYVNLNTVGDGALQTLVVSELCILIMLQCRLFTLIWASYILLSLLAFLLRGA